MSSDEFRFMMIYDLGFIHDLDDLWVITGYSRTPRVEGETNSQGCRSVQRFIMARIHIDMLNKAQKKATDVINMLDL